MIEMSRDDGAQFAFNSAFSADLHVHGLTVLSLYWELDYENVSHRRVWTLGPQPHSYIQFFYEKPGQKRRRLAMQSGWPTFANSLAESIACKTSR